MKDAGVSNGGSEVCFMNILNNVHSGSMPPTDTLKHAALVFHHLHHTGKGLVKIRIEAEHQVN